MTENVLHFDTEADFEVYCEENKITRALFDFEVYCEEDIINKAQLEVKKIVNYQNSLNHRNQDHRQEK